MGTRLQRTHWSLVGCSTNTKAIPWFAQHTSSVDGRLNVVTVLEEWASAPELDVVRVALVLNESH
jgi:hypothetical protein